MRTLQQPVFILCVALFAINQLLEWRGVYLQPINFYLDDLLCMPVVLTIVLAGERLYFGDNGFILPVKYVAVAVVLFSLWFEVVLPLFSATYTSDILDVLFYSLGAILFLATINRPLMQSGRHYK